jgi:hypothetical protein
MKTFKGVFIKQDNQWFVQYDSELGNGIELTNTIMLHPNQTNYAKVGDECEFRIQSSPNFANGGEWEDMAIIDTGEAKRISEIMEKFKDKEMFPKLNAHAREILSNVKTLPEPNNKPILYNEDELFQILMDFVAFPHDHMEPRGSIITRFLEELKNKK